MHYGRHGHGGADSLLAAPLQQLSGSTSSSTQTVAAAAVSLNNLT